MATVENKKNPETKPATPAPAAVKPIAAVPSDGPATPAQTAEQTEEGEEKARGAIPQMPTCVVWRNPATKRVTAALIHPKGGIFKVEGKGMGGTQGALADEGYPTSGIKADGPKWVYKHIPKDVEVLGFATILGFPLPETNS